MLSFVDTASGTLSDEEIDEIDAPIVFTHYPLAPIHHDFMGMGIQMAFCQFHGFPYHNG